MPSPSPTDEPDVRIDAGRVFEYAPERPIGRDEYIRRLDVALGDAGTRVVTLVAWGGVGKTSLVAHWLAQLAQRNWPGLDRVFAWSFYSQGTREQGGARQRSSRRHSTFRRPGLPEAPPARDKGQRIARLAAEHRTLLVLDGLDRYSTRPAVSTSKAGSRTRPSRRSLSRLPSRARRRRHGRLLRGHDARACHRSARFPDDHRARVALDHLVPEAGRRRALECRRAKGRRRAIKADYSEELRGASRGGPRPRPYSPAPRELPFPRPSWRHP